MPAGQPLSFNWSARPSVAGPIYGYRWALDPASLDDETPRSGPGDWSHWSDWDLATTSATVGPFAGTDGEVHDFFVEAKDVTGYVSLGWVRFSPFAVTCDRDLLIVNDTRFAVDQCRARSRQAARTA